MKTFEFNNQAMTIEKTHMYGHYILKGLGTNIMTTDSEIWDYVDDEEENPDKAEEAKKRAYKLLEANNY